MSQLRLRLDLRFLKLPPPSEGTATPQLSLQKSAGPVHFWVANLTVSD